MMKMKKVNGWVNVGLSIWIGLALLIYLTGCVVSRERIYSYKRVRYNGDAGRDEITAAMRMDPELALDYVIVEVDDVFASIPDGVRKGLDGFVIPIALIHRLATGDQFFFAGWRYVRLHKLLRWIRPIEPHHELRSKTAVNEKLVKKSASIVRSHFDVPERWLGKAGQGSKFDI
jgi:hypothetical protein